MIIHQDPQRLRLVTQSDHAHFAAAVLGLWTAQGLPDHPRRREILLATREHDNGWREEDSAPRRDPETGRPHDFISLPNRPRAEVWERGSRRLAEEEPYAALLIVTHALAILGHRRDDPIIGALVERLEALRGELFEGTGADPEEIADQYRLLDFADLLSLAVCNSWDESFERYGNRGLFRDDTLYLDPFPLAGATTFQIPFREVDNQAYENDVALSVAVARARWRRWSVRLAPWSEAPLPEAEEGEEKA